LSNIKVQVQDEISKSIRTESMTRRAIFAACRGENDYFVADY